jgi:hypothetical protein
VRDLLKEKITELDDRIKKLRDFRRTLTLHLEACEKELQKQGDAVSCPVIVKMTQPRKGKRNGAIE